MNCPYHIQIFNSRTRSYRDLPLRYAELGTVYRYERSGTLHGMLRVRGFTQDDSHIFCSWADAQAEIGKVFDLAMEFMNVFGYSDPVIYLSTRPERRLGTDAMWDKAEAALREALQNRQVEYKIDEGGGVFYAPKIDIKMRDAIGREWQGPTIQIDLNLPERFDVTYVNERSERERAVMIHRVLYGSLERFVGGLIEHYAGNFPLWLSWLQVVVIPLKPEQNERARELVAALRARGFRVEADDRLLDMRDKIKHAQGRKANYMLLIGNRELASGTVSIRPRHGPQEQNVRFEEFLARIEDERKTKALPSDFQAAAPSVAEAVAEQRAATS
jgi:threonyl-tRNA synthetase